MNIKSLFVAMSVFLLSSIVSAGPAVDGLVYLEHGGGFCSGSLFAPKDYDKTQKALVLTNGHCTGVGSSNIFGGTYLSATERINYVEAKEMTLYILKKGLDDVEGNMLSLNDQYDAQLMVATMYKKDIAIYQLGATYEELAQKGYLPLILATKAPALTTKVTYHSSAWGSQVTCTLEAYADMVIEGFWVWNNVMRMMGEGCYAQGGASGSPVLDEAGNLVAALNTMYEGGTKCSIMNPCERERDSGNSAVINGSVYSIPVVSLNACFDKNKKLDLALCDLQ